MLAGSGEVDYSCPVTLVGCSWASPTAIIRTMGDEQPPPRDLVREMVGWAMDHVEVEANFEGVPVLLVGDPDVLVDAPRSNEELPQGPWNWLDLPTGRALVVRGPGGNSDGPWVWVLGSDDGPLSSIEISPSLETSPPGTNPEPVGAIQCVSGRMVIGSPRASIGGHHR
jgi:hypothetical protein